MLDTRRLGAAPTALLRMLGAAGPLSFEGVMARLGLNRRQVSEAIRRLRQRGYARIDAHGVLSLTDTGLEAAARGEVIRGGPKGQVKTARDTFHERAWRAMRVRKSFTIGDIVADALGPSEVRPHDNPRRYVGRLKQAGYVAELPDGFQ